MPIGNLMEESRTYRATGLRLGVGGVQYRVVLNRMSAFDTSPRSEQNPEKSHVSHGPVQLLPLRSLQSRPPSLSFPNSERTHFRSRSRLLRQDNHFNTFAVFSNVPIFSRFELDCVYSSTQQRLR
nr:hypothetical protein CFP56_67054 [Quercus suber]